MADKQLNALTAAGATADADLFYTEQGGNSRKATGSQLKTYVGVGNQSTSLSQISSSLSGAISSTSSLSSAVSTVDSGQSVSLSQISSSLSGAISSTSSLSTAVSTVDANQSTSISANLSKINSLSTAIGSPGWTELYFYDGTTSIISQVINVTSYNDVKVSFKDVQMLSSGIPGVVVCTDGTGTNFFTASGDYVEISTAGIKTNDAAFFSHGTAATAARSGYVEIKGLRGTRAQKVALTPSYITAEMQFVADANAITHIKVYGISAPSTAISITAGTIQVEAR